MTSTPNIPLTDDFRGDDAQLISCIKALLEMDADGVLRPHGVGGHARGMLSAAAVRLASQPQPVNRAEQDRDALRQKGLDDHLRRLQAQDSKPHEDGWKGNPDTEMPVNRADGDAVPVAYTSPERLRKIAENPGMADTLWGSKLKEERDVALYLAAPLASTSADAQRYTQADMEAYGKAYADARDKRLAQTSTDAPAVVAWQVQRIDPVEGPSIWRVADHAVYLDCAANPERWNTRALGVIAAPIASALPAKAVASEGYVSVEALCNRLNQYPIPTRIGVTAVMKLIQEVAKEPDHE